MFNLDTVYPCNYCRAFRLQGLPSSRAPGPPPFPRWWIWGLHFGAPGPPSDGDRSPGTQEPVFVPRPSPGGGGEAQPCGVQWLGGPGITVENGEQEHVENVLHLKPWKKGLAVVEGRPPATCEVRRKERLFIPHTLHVWNAYMDSKSTTPKYLPVRMLWVSQSAASSSVNLSGTTGRLGRVPAVR